MTCWKTIALSALACALLITACGKKTEAPATAEAAPTAAAAVNLHDAGPPGDPKAGEVVYKRVCLACHQKDGTGLNGMLGANFVKDKTRLAKPDSELIKSITFGKKTKGKSVFMPPQKATLTEKEIKDALAYVRATFGG